MLEITLSTGEFIEFRPGDLRRYKGTYIPGGTLSEYDHKDFVIRKFNYEQRLFRFTLLHFINFTPITFTVRDKSNYIRLQTLVQGEVKIQFPAKDPVYMITGESMITDEKLYKASFINGECLLFSVYISPELLRQTEGGDQLKPAAPQMMSPSMKAIVKRFFNNPFEEVSRRGFYDTYTRELLFYHVAAPDFLLEESSLAKETAATYAAAHLIAEDLSIHHEIDVLAAKVGISEKRIKQGFKRLFGCGPYEYRLRLKMETAKHLLSSTDKKIKEIAFDAGYLDSTAFNREFKNQFGASPWVWRKQSRGKMR